MRASERSSNMASFTRRSFLVVALVLFTGQFLVFYVAIQQCDYPSSPADLIETSFSPLHVMIVSDVHLLGQRRRNRIQRLWNDWQAFISFRLARRIHRPDLVVFLGDQFDEGGLPTRDKDWNEYARRFKSIFQLPMEAVGSLKQHSLFVSGNHDVSFGRFTQYQEVRRYELAFGPSNHVQMAHNNKLALIVLNTMAMDHDVHQQSIAKHEAEIFLQDLSHQPQFRDSFKVLFTHVPLFRENDLLCGAQRLAKFQGGVTFESPDFAYQEFHHVLSKRLSRRLLKQLAPQVILSGHTHAFCEYKHEATPSSVPTSPLVEIPEYTMSSFSWGMRPDPSFALARILETKVDGSLAPNTSFSFQVQQCGLPHEHLVFAIYAGFAIVWSMGLALLAKTRSRGAIVHNLPKHLEEHNKKDR